MNVTIGIDVGTYSIKAVAVDDEGRICETVAIDHEVSIPKPGYAEHDPDAVWWDGILSTVRQLLQGDTFRTTDVRALGISTIAPCVVTLDANSRPLRPAILYGIDVRASAQVEFLRSRFGQEQSLRLFGQEFSSQSAGPKILWIKENEPDTFSRAVRFVPATTYLVYRLTGEWWIDRYIAPNYAPFFNLDTLSWDEEATEKYLSRSLIWPRIGNPSDVAGSLTKAAAKALGLLPGTPVIVGTADAMSEAVSAGAVEVSNLFVMYGSSIFFIGTTNDRLHLPNFWTSPGLSAPTWAVAGGMSTAGTLTRWLLKNFYPVGTTFESLFHEAQGSPPGSNGLITLPYFSGERTPIADPYARGIVAGLSLIHTRSDIVRSVLEGVAFGIKHNVELLKSAIGAVSFVSAGGGVIQTLWPQIVSNVCQEPQRIMKNTHAAIGDALLAGFGIGLYDEQHIRNLSLSIGDPFEVTPDRSVASLYDEMFCIYRDIYENTRSQIHQLSSGLIH